MKELTDLIYTEKYRPTRFEELILEDKPKLLSYLSNPKTLPSFIFYSSSPGTGKTSTAKVLTTHLGCDLLKLNASDERGIDTIRDKIKGFAMTLSTNGIKRCIFLDEADGLTKQAQDSLRNTMEEFSGNCFFVFSCNDVSKIIEPIRSRCVTISFENPNKVDILAKLSDICDKEEVKHEVSELEQLIDFHYPDIRSVLLLIQEAKLHGTKLALKEDTFMKFLDAMKKKNIPIIYDMVYSGSFNVVGFNKWLFRYLFKNYKAIPYEKLCKMSRLLADTEKAFEIGVNLEIVFLANIIQIAELF